MIFLPTRLVEEDLNNLKKEVPEVLLLDLDLPDISGLEIMERMKKDIAMKDIPVIIFSNNDDPVIRKKVADIGIAGFFIKASTEYSELFLLIDTL